MIATRKLWAAFILLFFLASAGCQMPGMRTPEASPTSSLPPNPAYTAAAQTIIAQLTQVSNPASPTPMSSLAASSTLMPVTEAVIASPEVSVGLETPDTLEPETTVTPEAAAGAPDTTVTPEAAGERPTATEAVPTATLIPGDPRSDLGEPDWRDPFRSGDNWALYVDQFAAFEIIDGDLEMTAYQTSSRNAWMLAVPQPIDYFLEIIVQPMECEGRDRYGVIVRSDATEGYLFMFSCEGQYTFRKWDGKKATILVDWTPSDFIKSGPDQENRLGIKVEGSHIALYANGNRLDDVEDGSYPEGGFGVLIGAERTEDFIVRVKEAAYWDLP